MNLYRKKKGDYEYFLVRTGLVFLSSGNKRKRLNGGGKKLVFAELDHRLLLWYRSKRTDPRDESITPIDVRREKVTLRRLEKEGRKISRDLDQSPPSSSWYFRFLKRHGLSLQRPKRQQMVPLDEVHRLAHSFYSYIRRASKWSLKRGSMGAFTPRDVANMDELPLALFGDQSKKSINDVGTSNEISGYISNKVEYIQLTRLIDRKDETEFFDCFRDFVQLF